MDEHSPDHDPLKSRVNTELETAIEDFKREANYEKELSSNSIMIGHMIDFALRRVLELIVERRSTADIILFLKRAQQSFSSNRHNKHPSSNPIRVFKREH